MIETILILILSTEKLKLLNFLMDSVLITSEHIDKKTEISSSHPYENDSQVQTRLGLIWKTCVPLENFE